jgi:hypothetical protein
VSDDPTLGHDDSGPPAPEPAGGGQFSGDDRLPYEDFVEIDSSEADEDWPLDHGSPRWRRPLIVSVAVLTVVALALVPLYNLIDRGRPEIADNGLEVCGFDYCVVQDVVIAAGLDLAMSRLSTTYMSDDQAESLAANLLTHLGQGGVEFEMVDRLGGDIAGQYSPGERLIQVERPATAWIVIHEVAHVGTEAHGEAFRERLLELITWVESGGAGL